MQGEATLQQLVLICCRRLAVDVLEDEDWLCHPRKRRLRRLRAGAGDGCGAAVAGMRVLGYRADSDEAALRGAGAELIDSLEEVPRLLGLG